MWDQERIHRPHGHPYYHWLQTEQGCGNVSVNANEISLEKGQGIFISPFVPHAYWRTAPTWHTSFFTLTGRLAGDIEKIIGPESIVCVDSNEGENVQAWINKTIAEYTSGQIDDTKLSADCYTFLLMLSTNLTTPHDSDISPVKQYVQLAMQEIERCYAQVISTQALAESLFISPQYLSRLFKQYTGYSTYAYITNYRISRAKELLISKPSWAVQLVAHSVGFQDSSHFIDMFKKASGYTPRDFRALHGVLR